MKNQPIIKRRYGRNSIAIFCDEKVTNDGEIKANFSCSIQRSYKDKNNEWKESTLNCIIEDLLPLSSLLEQGYIDFQKMVSIPLFWMAVEQIKMENIRTFLKIKTNPWEN